MVHLCDLFVQFWDLFDDIVNFGSLTFDFDFCVLAVDVGFI